MLKMQEQLPDSRDGGVRATQEQLPGSQYLPMRSFAAKYSG